MENPTSPLQGNQHLSSNKTSTPYNPLTFGQQKVIHTCKLLQIVI